MEKTRRLKRGWFNLIVKKVLQETHDTVTLIMEDADEGSRPFDFIAGQYLTFRFDELGERPVVRSYTMSGSPCQQNITVVTVKKIEKGLVSTYLCEQVREGTVLRARGPIGKFCFDPNNDHPHLVMFAAGSGVTPFISIVREYASRLGEEGCPKTLSLLVSYRSMSDLICWSEIQDFRRISGVRIQVTLSREQNPESGMWKGRIDREMIERFYNEIPSPATIMTCGPDEMMHLVVETLTQKGIPSEHLKMESFAS